MAELHSMQNDEMLVAAANYYDMVQNSHVFNERVSGYPKPELYN
jgi:hypothetical protein